MKDSTSLRSVPMAITVCLILTATATAPAPAAPAPAADSTTGATDEKKQIRTVGPTFIPPKQ